VEKDGRDITLESLVPGVTSVDRSIPGAAGDLKTRVFAPAAAGRSR